jgi:Winged helix-turn-helix DNA-binding
MPNLQEITDAIDDRLVELRQQIASLQAARRALTGIQRSRPGGRTESRPAAATRTPAKPRRSRTTAPRRPTDSGSASASASAAASTPAPPAADRAVDQAEVTPPAKPARRRRPPASAAAGPTRSKPAQSVAATAPKARAKKPSPRSRRRELQPGEVEGLLRESGDGLSLVALARRVGVSEAKVSDRLRSLERSGEVRRSGPRRTSLWRLITDEERIAERAAELARVAQSKT